MILIARSEASIMDTWDNMFKYILILMVLIMPPVVSAEDYKDSMTALNLTNISNETVLSYNSTVKDYKALIKELQNNITKLQEEVNKKNRLLAEYIVYKKENIKLKENLTNLQKTIATLKAENEILKEENDEYRKIITELINKQSNETKEEYILAYREWKKDIANFKTALIVSVIGCIVVGVILLRLKQKYDYPF